MPSVSGGGKLIAKIFYEFWVNGEGRVCCLARGGFARQEEKMRGDFGFENGAVTRACFSERLSSR